MEENTNIIQYRLATAIVLDLLVSGKISQREFELIDEKNKASFGVG